MFLCTCLMLMIVQFFWFFKPLAFFCSTFLFIVSLFLPKTRCDIWKNFFLPKTRYLTPYEWRGLTTKNNIPIEFRHIHCSPASNRNQKPHSNFLQVWRDPATWLSWCPYCSLDEGHFHPWIDSGQREGFRDTVLVVPGPLQRRVLALRCRWCMVPLMKREEIS